MNLDKEFPLGLLRPELFMGVLASIAAYSVKVNLNDAGAPSGSHFSGSRYGKGEVGEFVLIEGQLNLILGRVIDVNLPEADRKTITPRYEGTPSLDAYGTIQLLGTVCMESLRVTAGIEAYPRLGDRVYAAPVKFVSKIPTLMDKSDDTEPVLTLAIGSVDIGSDTPDSKVLIRPEKLFGRHCAILGATGGGKSWTTAKLIEECLKHNCKIILLDATGEYRDFISPSITNCHLGTPLNIAAGSLCASLPPTSFQESDFIALFEPAGKVQGPKMREALRSLRMARLCPDLFPEGIVCKIDRPKNNYNTALARPAVNSNVDNPYQPFNVANIVRQIEQECVYPEGFGTARGTKDPSKWGGEDGNYSYCGALITRISAVLSSPSFNCVFQATANPLTDQIDAFYFATDKKMLRVCLSGISYEYKAREIIANVIGRELLNRARRGDFRNRPLVVIVDEAHNFLGRNIGNEDTVAKLDAFELLAKEGRKYGLNICLATQRPRDITEGVLSQMGTLIVHRLTNDKDREVVGRACGEIDRAAASFLPNLKPGEAAIIGTDFPIPLTIQICQPIVKPLSDGPNYQKHWK
jgi:Predicted ATPase